MKKLTEKLKSLWAKINQLRKKDNDQLKELSDPENNAEQAGPDQAQTLVKKITHSLSDKIKSILPLKKNKTSPAHDKKPIVNLNPLKWQKALENIFKVDSRGKNHGIFLIALWISGAYMMGKTSALLFQMLRPSAKITTPKIYIQVPNLTAELAQIEKDNLFKASLDAAKTPDAGQVLVDSSLCSESKQKSALPLTLIDTVVLQDSVKSLASVQVRGASDPQRFREGDQIDSIAKIDKIDRLTVYIRNKQNGQCEYLSNDTQLTKISKNSKFSVLNQERGQALIESLKPDGISNEGNNYKISKKLRDEKLQDIQSLLGQAQAVQLQNPDGTLSFKLTHIEPGGFFSYFGVQQDDIITKINGKSIRNMNDVLNLFSRIKYLDHFTLTLRREEEEFDSAYDFVE